MEDTIEFYSGCMKIYKFNIVSWLCAKARWFLCEWVLDWLLNVQCNDVSVIYVTAHGCAGGLNKFDLRSGSQRHKHFVRFFNVPVQAPTRGQPFYTVIPRNRPIKSPFTTRWGYGGHIRWFLCKSAVKNELDLLPSRADTRSNKHTNTISRWCANMQMRQRPFAQIRYHAFVLTQFTLKVKSCNSAWIRTPTPCCCNFQLL